MFLIEVMKKKIVISELDYSKRDHLFWDQWEKSVEIIQYEKDYVNKIVTIDYKCIHHIGEIKEEEFIFEKAEFKEI